MCTLVGSLQRKTTQHSLNFLFNRFSILHSLTTSSVSRSFRYPLSLDLSLSLSTSLARERERAAVFVLLSNIYYTSPSSLTSLLARAAACLTTAKHVYLSSMIEIKRHALNWSKSLFSQDSNWNLQDQLVLSDRSLLVVN